MRRREKAAPPPQVLSILGTEEEIPTVVQIGACVEIWGPTAAVPAGLGPDADDYFAAATGRHARVRAAIAPRSPNQHRNGAPAWSLDGRFRLALRLRQIEQCPGYAPGVPGPEAFRDITDDLPALRKSAVTLLKRVQGAA